MTTIFSMPPLKKKNYTHPPSFFSIYFECILLRTARVTLTHSHLEASGDPQHMSCPLGLMFTSHPLMCTLVRISYTPQIWTPDGALTKAWLKLNWIKLKFNFIRNITNGPLKPFISLLWVLNDHLLAFCRIMWFPSRHAFLQFTFTQLTSP